LSRKGAKSQTQGRKLRSTGTKAGARVGHIEEPAAELEKKLAEALEQQAATVAPAVRLHHGVELSAAAEIIDRIDHRRPGIDGETFGHYVHPYFLAQIGPIPRSMLSRLVSSRPQQEHEPVRMP